MNAHDPQWLQDRIRDRWEKLAHAKLDVTDADNIKDELARTYGYEREKAEYEYEQFMNELVGKNERAEHHQEDLGDRQARGPLSERLDD